MLRILTEVLLGPVKPPRHHAQDDGETRPCNVVGGCGAGCLCVPDQSACPSAAPPFAEPPAGDQARRQ